VVGSTFLPSSMSGLSVPSPLLIVTISLCYVPVLVISMLFSSELPSEAIMEKTPRRTAFVRKRREEDRFVVYLGSRAGWVILCTLITGWLAAVTRTTAGSDELSLRSTCDITTTTTSTSGGGNGDMTSCADLDLYNEASRWFVHNAMGMQVILGLIAQAATLLHRGQSLNQLPTPRTHPAFYAAIGIITTIQTLVVLGQAWFRGALSGSFSGQTGLWVLGLAMILGPLGGLAVGAAGNAADLNWHLRYLKFLRLEFDTRLGMHSPR